MSPQPTSPCPRRPIRESLSEGSLSEEARPMGR